MHIEAIKLYGAAILFTFGVIGGLNMCMAHVRRAGAMPPAEDIDFDSAESVKRRNKMDNLNNGTFLVLAIGFGTLAYYALRALARLRFALLPSAQLSFSASNWFLGVIAMFWGIGFAILFTCPLISSWDNNGERFYSAFLSQCRYHCNYDRLCRRLGIAIILLMLIPLSLGLNWYVQVRSNAFVFHPFIGVHEQVYRFSEIEAIITAPEFVAPNGRVRHERDFVVHFRNGKRWVASDLPSGDVYEREEVANLLSKKSGVPITETPIFQTGDLYGF